MFLLSGPPQAGRRNETNCWAALSASAGWMEYTANSFALLRKLIEKGDCLVRFFDVIFNAFRTQQLFSFGAGMQHQFYSAW
jgi:hypothetical protein